MNEPWWLITYLVLLGVAGLALVAYGLAGLLKRDPPKKEDQDGGAA